MKQGLIVYLVGESELEQGFNLNTALQEMGFSPDQVGLVSARQGFFDVEEAWHFLFTRGCGRIDLMVAQAAGPAQLQALKPPVHLCG